jgi:hypothetical protein
MSAVPPISASAPAAALGVGIHTLVHSALTNRVPFVAFPPSFQALPIWALRAVIYDPTSEIFVDFLYALKGTFFRPPPPGTDYHAFIANVLRDRVLLETRGVWIATTDAQLDVMHTYLNSIHSLPDLVLQLAYGRVPTEWLFPVFFGPDALPLHLPSLPGVSWWLPAPRSACSPGSSVQSDADHLSDSESLLSEPATSA